MDNATITQSEASGLYQSGRYPSVITTDDLVFELGKVAVERLNHERLMEGLLNKSKQADADIVKLRENLAQVVKDCAALKSSNTLYEANNRKLGDELVIARRTITEKDQKLASLTTTLSSERNSWVAEKTRIQFAHASEKEAIHQEYEQKIQDLQQPSPKKRTVRKRKNG
jgi:hypothetical protein